MTDTTFAETLAEYAQRYGTKIDPHGSGVALLRMIVEAGIKERDQYIANALQETADALNKYPGNNDVVSALDHLASMLCPE